MVCLKALFDTRRNKPLLLVHNPRQKPHRQDFYSSILKLLGMFSLCSLMALFLFHTVTSFGQQVSFTTIEKSNLQYTNPMVYAIITRFHQRKPDSASTSAADPVNNGKSPTSTDNKFDLPTVDDSDVLVF